MGAGISCAAVSSSFSFLFRRKEKQKEAKRKEKPDDVNKKPVEKNGVNKGPYVQSGSDGHTKAGA
ncbi:MAG: hypothetical protein SPE28_04785 [Eubacteriales bacterium]|nr:hypothetical protein [Clostridiales bacterium]MDD5908743.1 hypothetical protein [Clostridiales bacterium]MDY4469833.1 hypothetical protein [Eubacteriales bacterium]